MFDAFLNYTVNVGFLDPSEPGVHPKHLGPRHCVDQTVVLWAVPNPLPHLLELRRHVETVKFNPARTHVDLASQHSEGGGFPCAVDAKKPKALTAWNPK